MRTAGSDKDPEPLNRVSEVQRQLSTLQDELRAMVHFAGLQATLPELHDKATGRINAQRVATYMGVPLTRLAEALGLNYKAIHRSPSAEAAQAALKPVKRCLEVLHEFFQKPETVRVWLNTPHPDLEGHTAFEMILVNHSSAVLRILENAAAGVPV